MQRKILVETLEKVLPHLPADSDIQREIQKLIDTPQGIVYVVDEDDLDRAEVEVPEEEDVQYVLDQIAEGLCDGMFSPEETIRDYWIAKGWTEEDKSILFPFHVVKNGNETVKIFVQNRKFLEFMKKYRMDGDEREDEVQIHCFAIENIFDEEDGIGKDHEYYEILSQMVFMSKAKGEIDSFAYDYGVA